MQEPRYPLPRVILCNVSRRRPQEHRVRVRERIINSFMFLGAQCAGVCVLAEGSRARRGPPCPDEAEALDLKPTPRVYTNSQVELIEASTMILPQVHLRKPCYDFSFL